ncbi:hypothetical protein ACWEQN_22520 [Streptomyces sp. NPDC004129]|uniref:hypothetical protein n=1 Tax=Streptomyces sp. NPDC004533 TaxID=3154278 RepID=UPI0033B51078
MKSFLPPAALVGVLLSLAAVTGCSATTKDAGPERQTRYAAGQGADPSAAKAADTAPSGCPAASLPLPKDFPATLPVPDSAVVTSVEHRTGNRLVVATVVRGGFDAALAFLHRQLPKAGYALKEGEVERDDAESNFSSASVNGRWTLQKMADCEGGVYLTYLTSWVSTNK